MGGCTRAVAEPCQVGRACRPGRSFSMAGHRRRSCCRRGSASDEVQLELAPRISILRILVLLMRSFELEARQAVQVMTFVAIVVAVIAVPRIRLPLEPVLPVQPAGRLLPLPVFSIALAQPFLSSASSYAFFVSSTFLCSYSASSSLSFRFYSSAQGSIASSVPSTYLSAKYWRMPWLPLAMMGRLIVFNGFPSTWMFFSFLCLPSK